MNWQGKRVLVTGAGGFIGSHLTERLVELGAEVRAMVHYNALGRHGWLDQSPLAHDMQIVAGDLADRDSVSQAVAGREIVFHLGALIAIPYSYGAPLSYVRTNVEGTLNVLQAVTAQGCERMIHTSTSEVYGSAQRVPIDESHPLQAQSPYSASKIAADKLAEAYYCSFDTPVVTVRPFNTFGPRQSARAVIPTIISQCLTSGVVRLGSLHPTRDLNYVANQVDGFVRAAAADGIVGRTIHLGSGREITIGDLAHLIGQLADCPLIVEEDRQRIRPGKSEVTRLLADHTLATELLGWKPAIDLEQGLQLTIDWVRENVEYFRTDAYAV